VVRFREPQLLRRIVKCLQCGPASLIESWVPPTGWGFGTPDLKPPSVEINVLPLQALDFARPQPGKEGQDGGNVGKPPSWFGLRSFEEPFLFLVWQSLTCRRLDVLEGSVILLEPIPKPRMPKDLSQNG
jgi:hypothetical protein